MGFVQGLRCKECGKKYPKEPTHVCDFCFGPLEIVYDYEAIGKQISRESIQEGPQSIWRYRDLMPIDGEPTVGLEVGMTPLIRAERLGSELGLNNLFVKNDSVCCPSLSFKDRVVAVAANKAMEFGFDTLSCASTGNLANSVAAHAASAGLKSVIFIPADLEMGKIIGTLVYGPTLVGVDGVYDDVNRLCAEIASSYPWAFVNINIRPFYGDGSKSYGYEVMEQLGWRTPDHIIVPVAGSSLITKIWKAFHEFRDLGLIDEITTRVYAAQATGCSPVTTAVKNGWDHFKPQRPDTIAKSIAIGNPADGYYGIKVCRESEGGGEDVSDEEIVSAMHLLAETEGIFTETAGGVTVGVTKKLVEQGRIKPDDATVICVTGNGLKTQEAIQDSVPSPLRIDSKFSSFQEMFAEQLKEA